MTNTERILLSAIIKVGAECHRAKWQFDDGTQAGGVAFNTLHRIGDIAKDALTQFETRAKATGEG